MSSGSSALRSLITEIPSDSKLEDISTIDMALGYYMRLKAPTTHIPYLYSTLTATTWSEAAALIVERAAHHRQSKVLVLGSLRSCLSLLREMPQVVSFQVQDLNEGFYGAIYGQPFLGHTQIPDDIMAGIVEYDNGIEKVIVSSKDRPSFLTL